MEKGKTCVTCKQWKLFSNYWRHSSGRFGLRPQCKVCIRNVQRRYRKSSSGKIHGRKKIIHQYGLSVDKFNEQLENQKFRCFICRKISKKTLFIDHDHKNGKVRGLLCNRCNVGLANFDDDISRIKWAALYLRRDVDLRDLKDASTRKRNK